MVLTNSAIHGVIRQSDYFEKDIANEENIGGYYIAKEHDFVYNPRISENAPYGPLNANELGEPGIVSPLYSVFELFKKQDVDYDFLRYYFASAQWHGYMYSIANYGARFDRMNITDADFMAMPCYLPSLIEQKKIAEILGCCDEVIRLKKKLIAEKKKQKKALMQKLLDPNSGFRLPGFEGEWRETSIGEIADLLTGYPFESNHFSSKGTKLLRCSNIKRGELDFTPAITVYWAETTGLDDYLLKVNDIVMAMDGALVGYSFAQIKKQNIPLLLVQRVARLRAKSIFPDFLKYLIMNPAFGAYSDAVKTTTAIPHICSKDILEFKAHIPNDIQEQQALANILSTADHEIDLLEQELSQQERKKKSLMQLLLTGIVRVLA